MEEETIPRRRLSPKSEKSLERSILVADNDPKLREECADLLSKQGFAIVTASDGRDAVNKFIETRPEVVILACRMDGGDGLEAAGEILAMKPSSKIIMLTVKGYDIGDAERIGIELFIQKPVSTKKLLAAVNALSGIKPTSRIVSR